MSPFHQELGPHDLPQFSPYDDICLCTKIMDNEVHETRSTMSISVTYISFISWHVRAHNSQICPFLLLFQNLRNGWCWGYPASRLWQWYRNGQGLSSGPGSLFLTFFSYYNLYVTIYIHLYPAGWICGWWRTQSRIPQHCGATSSHGSYGWYGTEGCLCGWWGPI